ncbi:unnamed protein product [Penicillium bialowiezense]
MFGTFRYNRNTNDHEHIEISRADGVEARGFTRIACNSCRERKLKCSGEKAGCKKCRSMSQKCIYKSTPSSPNSPRSQHSGASSTRRPSLIAPDLSTTRVPSAPKPQGPNSPHRLVSAAAPPVTEPSITSTLADICPSLPANSLSPACFYDNNSDWDVYAADSIFVPNGGPGTTQDLAGSTGSTGETDMGDAFRSSRRRTDDPSWSLPSTRPVLQFGLDDDGILSMPPQVPRGNQRLQQHQGRNQGEHHVWDLDMDISSTDPQFQRPPSEVYSQGSGPGTEIDANLRSRNNAIVLPSPDATSGSNSTYAETSQGSSDLKRPAGSDRSCKCLRIMAQALQTVDAQGAGTDGDTKKVGIDMLVILLGRGMETLEEVLSCDQCNVCVDNGIIVATLAQQLSFVCESAARDLVAHSHQLEAASSRPGSECSDSSNAMFDGVISFGRCQIEAPRMRLSLVRHAVFLHVAVLQKLLGRTKRLMSRSRGAWKLLTDIEAKMNSADRIPDQVAYQSLLLTLWKTRDYQSPASQYLSSKVNKINPGHRARQYPHTAQP